MQTGHSDIWSRLFLSVRRIIIGNTKVDAKAEFPIEYRIMHTAVCSVQVPRQQIQEVQEDLRPATHVSPAKLV